MKKLGMISLFLTILTLNFSLADTKTNRWGIMGIYHNGYERLVFSPHVIEPLFSGADLTVYKFRDDTYPARKFSLGITYIVYSLKFLEFQTGSFFVIKSGERYQGELGFRIKIDEYLYTSEYDFNYKISAEHNLTYFAFPVLARLKLPFVITPLIEAGFINILYLSAKTKYEVFYTSNLPTNFEEETLKFIGPLASQEINPLDNKSRFQIAINLGIGLRIKNIEFLARLYGNDNIGGCLDFRSEFID